MKSDLHESLLRPAAPATPGSCVAWKLILFVNVFFACISFSIVMPSLFLYLDGMGASAELYASVVAAYSVGEALGSMALGALSNYLGAKRTMQLCALISLSGSVSYALADAVHRIGSDLGPTVVLLARLLQGVGSGGQQAVEQSCFAILAPPEERTSLTSQLSTFACLGFIFGPALGAAVTQTPDFAVGALLFNSFTKQGWVVAVLNTSMFLSTSFGFPELSTPGSTSTVAAEDSPAPGADTLSSSATMAVWACIVIFFVHFNGFAIQETITTPLVKVHRAAQLRTASRRLRSPHPSSLVLSPSLCPSLSPSLVRAQDWFGWDDIETNFLFTAAGVANLLCAMLMSILTRARGPSAPLVGDRTLLASSCMLAAAGWLLMVPPDGWGLLVPPDGSGLLVPPDGSGLLVPPNGSGLTGPPRATMGFGQFGLSFGLVTVAFPFGRGVCLSMVGKLLGERPQGAWMGIMFAVGAIARIVGPFWAVTGYASLGAVSVFASSALLFVVSLVAIRLLWPVLASPTATEMAAVSTSPTIPTFIVGGHERPRTRIAVAMEEVRRWRS